MKVKHTQDGDVEVTLDLETAEILRSYLAISGSIGIVSDYSWDTLSTLDEALAEAGIDEGNL
jgi:hypothetical protein